jgi:hypothetical protein
MRENPVDECGEERLAKAAAGVRHREAAQEFAAVAVVPVLQDGKALRHAARVETDDIEPIVVGEVGAVYLFLVASDQHVVAGQALGRHDEGNVVGGRAAERYHAARLPAQFDHVECVLPHRIRGDHDMSMIGYLAAIDAETEARIRDDEEVVAEIIDTLDEDDEQSPTLRIEKMWQAIHFMLTGQAFGGVGPLASVIMGGTEVGPDVGYGPARLLSAADVRGASAALDAIGVEAFKKKFAPAAMEREMIYPQGIWERDKDELPAELAHHFERIVQFYREAAARGASVLLWIA